MSAKVKRIERITFYLLFFIWAMIHPPDTPKKAVFCMVVRLVDMIYELILISLFGEIDWTNHLSV